VFAYGLGEAAGLLLALWWIITIALAIWTFRALAHHHAA
jgi:hypothetical protein